jgi:MFS family permease
VIKVSEIKALPTEVKQYLIITGNYWAFTLTDGALRMLVLLYFYQLGYQPLALALLFVFYEVFGVVTNLVGGWLGARIGLNKTMNIGLLLQVFALLMLTVPSEWLSIAWVMTAQALSGIAKDLNKMSAKSSIKSLLSQNTSNSDLTSSARVSVDKASKQQSQLFYWVALLTGSKNALKGAGFFLGGFLLTLLGFQNAVLLMAVVLSAIAISSVIFLQQDLGKAKYKAKFREMFSKNSSLNYLAAARLCLFAARDVWFVIALPVFFIAQFNWSHHAVGSFMACWIIAYGITQSMTPKFISVAKCISTLGEQLAFWAILLSMLTLVIAVALLNDFAVMPVVIAGLFCFGVVFAVNSSLHSFAIVSMAKENGVSLDVGFYYMANAMGRLLGTMLSGWLFQWYGLAVCLFVSVILSLCSAFFIRKI